jgi:hypothetical protein
MLNFKIQPSTNLQTSTYLFEKLGSSKTTTGATSVEDTSGACPGFRGSKTYLYIDTYIRITAATTGASIDVPIRYLKKSGTS